MLCFTWFSLFFGYKKDVASNYIGYYYNNSILICQILYINLTEQLMYKL